MKLRTLVWPTLVMCLMSMSSCSQPENFDQMVLSMTEQTVPFARTADLNPAEVILLDARDAEEYEVSHLPGAIRIGYTDFDPASLKGLPKDKSIVVYCSVGYRSEKIAERLVELGYSETKNLYGGIFAWKNEGREVMNDNGVTEQVHTYNESWSKWLLKGEKVFDSKD